VDHCDYCEREFALCVSTAFLSLMEVGDIWDENCASQAGVKTGGELLDGRGQMNNTSADSS
jgi:hypothetical protein